jgi:predicted DNA-binding ribbon-helix-helix protein
VKKISVSLSGHQTSITIEDDFLETLRKIAALDKTSVSAIINSIDSARENDSNLSSQIRVWILRRLLQISKL